MDLFDFQLCMYSMFSSYIPRVNPSLLGSAGLLCIYLLVGFLPSLKEPLELEYFLVKNMILRRMMVASPFKVN